jgi:hypothetical protein
VNRHELANAIRTANKDLNVSNIKFYCLLVSRLAEFPNLPYNDAALIAANMEYDFSNVPEDNDILPQIATELSEYCYKIYKVMKINGIKNIEPLLKYFQPAFSLKVDTV